MKIKNGVFLYSTAVFTPEYIVGDLVGHCKKEEITKDGKPDKICSFQIITDGEAVRCKDCKHWAENKTTKGSYRNCIFSKTIMHADDFCSRGERKDG